MAAININVDYGLFSSILILIMKNLCKEFCFISFLLSPLCFGLFILFFFFAAYAGAHRHIFSFTSIKHKPSRKIFLHYDEREEHNDMKCLCLFLARKLYSSMAQ